MSHSTPPLTMPGRLVSAPDLQGATDDLNTPEKVVQAFEEMLVSQLFKAARKSSPLQSQDFGHSMFQEMFDEKIAQHVAEQGLGIGDTILRDFVPHVAKGPTKTVDEAYGDKRWQSPLFQRGEER